MCASGKNAVKNAVLLMTLERVRRSMMIIIFHADDDDGQAHKYSYRDQPSSSKSSLKCRRACAVSGESSEIIEISATKYIDESF